MTNIIPSFAHDSVNDQIHRLHFEAQFQENIAMLTVTYLSLEMFCYPS